jgi:2-methylcitrate dehydratase
MPCRIQVVLRDGRAIVKESRDYPGFLSQPMSWEAARVKFNLLMEPYTTAADRTAVADAVADLENTRICDLMKLLTHVRESAAVGNGNHAWASLGKCVGTL